MGTINNDCLLTLITTATQLSKDKVVLVGDFNLPDIDWMNMTAPGSENNLSNKFLLNLFDNGLFQHIMENTRIRGRNQPSLLDLVITSDEESIFDIALLAPLGKSDHTAITFKYNYIIQNKKMVEVQESTILELITRNYERSWI